MVTSEELDMTFQKIGNNFDLRGVKTEYAPFRDLKINGTGHSTGHPSR
ncbi:MAG: hypothetical protein J5920_03775 [Candidatus Methanomethylophilaceae archaeon]|nr:hypothetical protein [Candidatus Methanomethylophilaceae archaeon]